MTMFDNLAAKIDSQLASIRAEADAALAEGDTDGHWYLMGKLTTLCDVRWNLMVQCENEEYDRTHQPIITFVIPGL